MGAECAFCGSDVERHDPVFVTDGAAADRSRPFCNYACLAAYIEAEGLSDGAACEWNP